MRTPILLGLAALFACAPLMLITNAPATAQTAPSSVTRAKSALKDISESVGTTSLKMLAGISTADTLNYNIGYHGEAIVSTEGGVAANKNTSNQSLTFTFKKSAKDGDPMDVEVKCDMVSFTIESHNPGQATGKHVSFMARTGGGDGTGLFVDGIEETTPPKGMPTASTVSSNMSSAVAFGSLGKTNQELMRPSHSARFTDTAEENLPHNLLDPVTAMRWILAGFGGREVKLGESVTFDTTLSTDTAGSAPAAYSLTLKAEKALGSDKEAEAVHFALTATPKNGATMDLGGGVVVPAPALSGHAVIELKRGVVLTLVASGTYAGDASGSIRFRADLADKK